ncbi:hypothetical protein PUN28_020090 [Cardiocondyla obscurior]|uniref:Secreted protein n=1 Tax=Cardiocondyla obscurior TaxID=286306 RepID=A0AAW2EA76_9HYME
MCACRSSVSSTRILVKLVCAPAPFHVPSTGFGSRVTITPYSSAMWCRRNRAIHRSLCNEPRRSRGRSLCRLRRRSNTDPS